MTKIIFYILLVMTKSTLASGFQSIILKDQKRNKKIDVSIWYPKDLITEKRLRPTIVLSHGFSGEPPDFLWLIEPFVRAGYIVLGVKHQDLPGPQINHWNRPADIIFTLNHLKGTHWSNLIDYNKIGFVGFSIGGMTGIFLAGAKILNFKKIIPDERYVRKSSIIKEIKDGRSSLQEKQMLKSYYDRRIKAAFLIAPAWSWAFEAKEVNKIQIPVEIVSGDKDELLVAETNAKWYAAQIPNSSFEWIKGVGHFEFIGKSNEVGQKILEVEKKAIAFFNLNL